MNVRTAIRRVVAGLAVATALVGVGTVHPAGAADGDPSQWGRSVSQQARSDGFDASTTPRHGIFGSDGPEASAADFHMVMG
jgi:hypothetical protein